MSKKNIILLGILIIAIFLRFYKLGEVPSGLYVDEAAVGYNAYSFLQTGEDEYGKRWPVFLKSFEAYSSPLYTYATIIPVKLFGLNEFSVRFISAVSGVLSVVLLWLISNGSFWAIWLMAISPWGLFLSRMGTEGHLAFVLWLAGIYGYKRSREDNKWLCFSFFAFGLAANTYQAMRLVVPLTIIGFFIFLPVRKWFKSVWFYLSVLIMAILVSPQLWLIGNGAFSIRANGLFYKEAIENGITNLKWLPMPFSWLYVFMREFLSQLVTYFNPYALFYLGDSDLQRSVPEISVLYQWMVIPYLVGIYQLIRKVNKDESKLILITAFSAAVVAALTKDPFSSVRSQGLLLPFILMMALTLDKFSKKWQLFFLGLSILSLGNWWRCYFWVFPSERAINWSYGYKQLTEEIKQRQSDLFLIDQGRTKPPYIEILFFLKYPPKEYQKQFDKIEKDYYQTGNLSLERKFSNVEIRNIDWKNDIYKEQIIIADDLAISDVQEKEHSLTKLFSINDPYDKVIFNAYQTNPKQKCILDNFKSENCRLFKK